MNIFQGLTTATLAVVMLMSVSPPAVSAEAKVTISKRDCQRLVRHQAGAHVVFNPGVDVRGNKVTGANLRRDQETKLLKEFSFNLNIDIAQKYGLDATGISADVVVGKVTVKGRNVYFKDQRLESGDHAAVTEHCQKTLNGG